jgi:hypothetical protein
MTVALLHELAYVHLQLFGQFIESHHLSSQALANHGAKRIGRLAGLAVRHGKQKDSPDQSQG